MRICISVCQNKNAARERDGADSETGCIITDRVRCM